MELVNEEKRKVIEKFSQHEGDTGSTVVQVALLSSRIGKLTEHLRLNTKDFHSRRGLLKMVGARRRLLRYLKTKHEDQYLHVIKSLSLRHVH